jgi:hypothetical protein
MAGDEQLWREVKDRVLDHVRELRRLAAEWSDARRDVLRQLAPWCQREADELCRRIDADESPLRVLKALVGFQEAVLRYYFRFRGGT